MFLWDEIYRNEGYRIFIIFFGLFLIGITLFFGCGKEGGRRPQKQLQKQYDAGGGGNGGGGERGKKKNKKEDPFESEKSNTKKRRKKLKNRRQKSPPISPQNHQQKVVSELNQKEECNENDEIGIQASENNINKNVTTPSAENDRPPPVPPNVDDTEPLQPDFGSDNEKQLKSAPKPPSECETQKPTEKVQSLKEQETPLNTDNYESLKEGTKNIDQGPPPPPSALTPLSPSNPTPEEAKDENDKESMKKSSKKKKKKHSKKKKKKDKISSKKKKASSKKLEKHEKQKEIKNDEPEIVYPYSLTSASTKKENLKETNKKGLTSIINDELMTTENIGGQQQLVEAKTQIMTIKTNVNQPEQSQIEADKTQKKTTAEGGGTKTNLLTGIEMNNE